MKPIRLEMKAFGSFREGMVDFTQMPDDLYLIAGDTGAGKTTIFDAIVFALYGEASGGDRKPKMLHSDFCSRKTDTEVTLQFLQNGKTYTVQRSMHFTKVRGQEIYSDTPTVKAQLTGEDEPALEKSEAVTRRVMELTGLTADQFRKIAMLAQGEFRAFLRDEKSRGEILGRLFDDTLYRRYEQLLKGASEQLRRSREEDSRRIAQALEPEQLSLPEEMDSAARAGFSPDSPTVVDNLTALTEDEGRREEALAGEIAAADARVKDLALRLDSARRINTALDRLDEARRKQAELAEEAPHMEAARQAMEAAARALHQVRPEQRAMEAAEEARRDSEKKLEAARSARQRAQECFEQRTAQAQAAAQEKQRQTALQAQAESIRLSLPEYQRREQLQQDLTRTEAALRAAEADREAKTAEARQIRERLTEIEEKLAGLSRAEAESAEAAAALERAQEQERRLAGENGWVAAVRTAKQAEADLEEVGAQGMRMKEEAVRKNDRHRELNRKFLEGQAGIFGGNMRSELNEKGRTVCPVCFAAYCAADHPHFAEPEKDMPSKEEVERAQREAEQAEDALKKQRERYAEQKSAAAANRSRAEELADTLGIREAWEQLTEAFLQEQVSQSAAAVRRARQEKHAADLRTQERQELEKRRAEGQRREREAASALEAAGRKAAEAQSAAAAARGALTGLSRLAFGSLTEAQAEMGRKKQEALAVAQRIEQAEEARKQAADAAAKAAGEAAAASTHLAQAGERLQTCRTAYEQARQAAGFSSEEAYRRALPAGEDAEAWLAGQRRVQEQYRTACAAAEKEVQLQEEAAREHPRRVDTGETERALTEEQAAKKALETAKEALHTRLDRHHLALAQVRAAKARLAGSDAAAQRLQYLAQLANNADAGAVESKTSFSRFMQSYIFRDILQEANVHMNEMSGGKYELVYRGQARDGRSSSGLLIDVKDNLTGEVRDTASLSGGESFQASLALALGLSGVVQRRSGVTRVDAMFIDEGFGTLSERELEAAIGVLTRISGGRRQIGIISHVAKLEESIPAQIRVTRSKEGSRVQMIW